MKLEKKKCPCGKTIDVVCTIPATYSHTGKEIQKKCGIDKCLVPIIKAFQAAKIMTVGCCCGHGAEKGNILLEDGTEISIRWR